MLYRPTQRLSIGIALSNIGPDITYRPNLPTQAESIIALPTTARLGLAWTLLENHSVRLRIMPELTKVIGGVSADTAGRDFGQQLGEQWRDIWKAVGLEATVFNLVSLRLGYFEDVNSERGGFMYGEDRIYQHLSITDVFTVTHAGGLKRVGLCWGFGIGYRDYFRIDVSSDAAIYDFPTRNWKLQFTCNDVGGLFGRRS